MKKALHFLCVVFIAVLFSCSSGGSPEAQMKEIDELMSKGYPLTSEQTLNLNTHLEEGKRLLGEGKSQESSEEFAKAMEILNMARDAYIFNKAD